MYETATVVHDHWKYCTVVHGLSLLAIAKAVILAWDALLDAQSAATVGRAASFPAERLWQNLDICSPRERRDPARARGRWYSPAGALPARRRRFAGACGNGTEICIIVS